MYHISCKMYIKIHATAGAKREEIAERGADAWEISVREKAEKGRANRRILELVRHIYRGKRVIMVAGHHSPHKIVSVEG